MEDLDEEMRRSWEPVLTPMGNLLWVNKIEGYSQFRTPRFVQVLPKEPLPDVEPVAAATGMIPIPPSTVDKFATSKPAKACLKKIVDTVMGRLLPKDSSRTTLHTEDIGYPRSIALGLTVGRGYRIAHQTSRFADLLPMIHKLASTRPSKERAPYLSVQVNYMEELAYMPLHYDARNDTDCSSWVISGGNYTGGLLWVEHPEGKYHPPRELWRTPTDATRRGFMYDTNQTWVKLPARHVLHGVTQVRGSRVSMSYYVPSFLYSLDVTITRTLDQIGFPIREWIQRNPKSVYVPLNEEFHTALDKQDSRGVEDLLAATIVPTTATAHMAQAAVLATADLETMLHTLEPHAMAVQELQTLPLDVDKHFAELAKAHPISMKAVRNTMSSEREKWKESMNKELKGLLDRDTYEEVTADSVPLSQVQNAPARMVYVVKPAVKDDGTRFVKRKSRLVICGNFLNPYGETSTANLDISVLRAVVTVGMTNGWSFSSADIPQAFLYASIEEGRH
eukprot:6465423-Amphidinium_carterae.1